MGEERLGKVRDVGHGLRALTSACLFGEQTKMPATG